MYSNREENVVFFKQDTTGNKVETLDVWKYFSILPDYL